MLPLIGFQGNNYFSIIAADLPASSSWKYFYPSAQAKSSHLPRSTDKAI